MTGMRYQPQGEARLDRMNPLLRTAQAIVLGGASVNLVSGTPLTVVGTGVAKRGVSGGIADSFRKNFYKATELLPAIGTQPFTEFCLVYANNDFGARGGSGNTGFFTGSSNNSTGIAGRIGQNNSQGGDGYFWGAATSTPWSNLTHGGGSFAYNELVLLMTVRHADRMEFWVNGALARSVPMAPTNHGASKFIVGSFIENVDYWTSSYDLLLAGRIIGAWTPDQIQQFSNNPWAIFAAPEDDDYVAAVAQAKALSVESARLAITAGQVGMRVARRLRADPVSLAIAPGAVALRARRQLSVSPPALAIAGGGIALRAGRRLSVAPTALAMTGGSVVLSYAPKPEPGSYTLSVSPAAVTLGGGNVGMRVSRRLRVTPVSLALSMRAARVLVGRRLLVSSAGLALAGGPVTLRFSARGEPFDISRIHPSRLVVFEGSGSRITLFDGSGSRVTPFEGSGSRITRFQ